MKNKQMQQKLIIDTDPGIDDAMAIHYAFAHPDLEVLGLTTIFGNVFVPQATRNALLLSEQAHYCVDVAEGAAQPLVQSLNPPSHHVHGAEGFGNVPVKQPYGMQVEISAADYIVKKCRQHSGEVILCPVGPLTNIAAALKADPELVNHVQKVVIMGGAVWSPGNVSAYAEANIWNDPHAADEVFAADWDIDLIGLDVTQKISCDDADFAYLRKAAPDIGGFLHEISAFYIKYYHSIFQKHVCLMHDPSALVAITDELLFGFKETPLSVVCEGEAVGQTMPDERSSRRPVRVAVSADVQRVKSCFLDICATADKMKRNRMASHAGS